MIVLAALMFGAVQMACACDIVLNESGSSAPHSQTEESHHSDQHHAPDRPCEGCEHCDAVPFFAQAKAETPMVKIDQRIELPAIVVSVREIVGSPPKTGPPDKLFRRSLPSHTPVTLKVRLLN